jgi:high affinity Mn2+ porin
MTTCPPPARSHARAALGAAATVAWAALGVAAQAAEPAPAPAAFVDWSGGYLGLQGSAGASYGAFTFAPTRIGGRPVAPFKTGDATGSNDIGRDATTAVGGVFGGWNWQTGPWLVGLEADINAANLKRPVPSTVPGFGTEAADPAFSLIRAKSDLYGSVRGRLGYSFENSLVYASFGLAGANARVIASYPDGAGGVVTAQRDLGFLGFTLGAGLQVAVHPNLALGIDYRYADLGSSGSFPLGTLPGPAGGPVSTATRFTAHQMMARLIWLPSGLRLPPEATSRRSSSASCSC